MMIYSRADSRVYPDSFPEANSYNTVFDFIRTRVPGVEVVGVMPYQTVRVRGYNSIKGNTTALMVLDGVPVEPYLINNIPMAQIAFVDVLRGLSNTAVFGAAGSQRRCGRVSQTP